MGAAAVAKTLGITRRQVLKKVDSGELVPLTKMDGVTGAYLFDPAVVEALSVQRECDRFAAR